jgi:hypothetical protein
MSRANHHEHTEEDEEYGASPAHTRIKGLLFLIGGSAGVLIAMLLSAYLVKHGLFPRRGGVPAMILIFIPICFALLGFVELLTGYEIRQVTRKWYDLKTWQRGILGTLLAFSPFIFYAIGVELF